MRAPVSDKRYRGTLIRVFIDAVIKNDTLALPAAMRHPTLRDRRRVIASRDVGGFAA